MRVVPKCWSHLGLGCNTSGYTILLSLAQKLLTALQNLFSPNGLKYHSETILWQAPSIWNVRICCKDFFTSSVEITFQQFPFKVNELFWLNPLWMWICVCACTYVCVASSTYPLTIAGKLNKKWAMMPKLLCSNFQQEKYLMSNICSNHS